MLQINNHSKNSGSIMIAALIVTLITGSLVGLFLKTITQEVENSYRFRMGFQAVNLAEAGLDYAIDAMTKDTWNSSNWTQGSNGYLGKNFPYVSYSWRGEQRDVWVYIEPDREIDTDGDGTPDSPVPAAVAEGVIRLRNGIEVRRQIYIELARGTSGGGFWGNGIHGEKGVFLGGNKQTVDSFTTWPFDPNDPDNPAHIADRNRYAGMAVENIYDEFTDWTRLGHFLGNPNGTVATPSVEVTDLSVGNADIYGRIATGADQESVDMKKLIGPNGSIYDPGSVFKSKKDSVDMGNIAYDFDSHQAPVSAPTLTSPNTTISGSQMGTAGTATAYELPSLSVPTTLTVQGNVTLVVDGDIDVKGEILLASGATLRVFLKGDLTVGGNGVTNTGSPRNLIIYNTTTEAEIAAGADRPEIKLHGNGFVSAAVHAPTADVSLRGGGSSGEMFGAVVGYTVTFSGNNYDFHYDESLAYLNDDELTKSNPEVTNWVELTAQGDRYDISTILTDGL